MTFDYDLKRAFEGTDKLLAELAGECYEIESLAKCRVEEDLTFGDLIESHPDEYKSYTDMVNSTLDSLITQNLITEDFYETHPREFDELSDHIDDFLEISLDEYYSTFCEN